LEKFGVSIGERSKKMLKRVWPGKVSVVLPCASKDFEYLHRGSHSLAFRMPDKAELNIFLQEVGPIVAPSANPEGLKPAETIEDAKKYFGQEVDFYVDGGVLSGDPSAVIKIENGKTTILRGESSLGGDNKTKK